MSRNDLELLIRKLADREEWLTKEAHNGGNWEHLNARRSECAYIRSLLTERLPSATEPSNG